MDILQEHGRAHARNALVREYVRGPFAASEALRWHILCVTGHAFRAKEPDMLSMFLGTTTVCCYILFSTFSEVLGAKDPEKKRLIVSNFPEISRL